MSKSVKKSVEKLLVANRSEIACRVFQAAREMGLKTVAIVAPGDEEARHVTLADEVVPVSSYLDVASVVGAAKQAGVHYIHPGYGFLSERSVFARAVEDAGMVFLGPRPETMDLMGGKIAAKEFASSVGVPTLPWKRVEKGGDWVAAANAVGFPLLLKAAAGGGGKGMRRVDRAEDLLAAAESASAEAVAAFGDGTLFLEKLVATPRHIEVQVFGDGEGGGIHLLERECSLQRRHQKVWEEAPAPNLSEETRKGLHESALKLVKATKYRSAGTLEFLVDDDGNFYFLEMNTRLQVEHPVTEAVTGVDLVCAQIELGRTGKTKLTQTPLARGHSIEVRLYAEDPAQGFIPTPGTVMKLNWPAGPGIRVDSGIELGQTITTSFDSMLAKIIVWAPNRDHAIERMKYALSETVVQGLGTNQSYLTAIAQDSRVKAAHVYTQYLEKEFVFDLVPSSSELSLAAAAFETGWGRLSGGGTSDSVGSAASDGPNPWVEFARGK